jgi:hypothetical protein
MKTGIELITEEYTRQKDAARYNAKQLEEQPPQDTQAMVEQSRKKAAAAYIATLTHQYHPKVDISELEILAETWVQKANNTETPKQEIIDCRNDLLQLIQIAKDHNDTKEPPEWPWDIATQHKTPNIKQNMIHNLVKAGALITAEIDRIQK